MENILSSIKQMLNVEQSITAFDNELIMFINSAIAELIQGGVGPQSGLDVTAETSWSAFSDNSNIVSHSKQYVYCRTRLLWDSPTNSFTVNSFNDQAKESYWRAYLEADEIRRKEADHGGN